MLGIFCLQQKRGLFLSVFAFLKEQSLSHRTLQRLTVKIPLNFICLLFCVPNNLPPLHQFIIMTFLAPVRIDLSRKAEGPAR